MRVQCPKEVAPVVKTAINLLDRDFRNVLGDSIFLTNQKPELCLSIGWDTDDSPKESFKIRVHKGQVHIQGSDAHGLAYGLMEISRMLGVSPWEWWADAVPSRKDSFCLPDNYHNQQSPSVEFRGIFINDEDWGLMPWSSLTHEPESGGKGIIGPRTNARIFELLLRLRANCYWPAMHECTQPFFLTCGNREVAQQYGIYIGGSHCEPMACSTAGEWPRRGKGEYDYVHNGENVREFWEQRLHEVKEQPILYTLGMRGVHDGKMQGAKTLEEQRITLQRIINDQRELLRHHVNPDLSQVPQVFIPYKEVLDIYNSGLQVPDDISLMWCDDNYGYIRHFPTPEEAARKGGNGIYYHVSYWGRPHDYLWLGTFHPDLLYQQMKLAYDHGIQRIWILNVGDIKPAEYQIELFMDMAWDINSVSSSGTQTHLFNFLSREFGKEASDLSRIMSQSYQLAFDCKPEFLGNTRTEEKDPKYKIVSDLPWTEATIRHRIQQYQSISDEVERIFFQIPESQKETYFQLIKYPVQAAAQMNFKMLYGQLARHHLADWSVSDAAYDSIQTLTEIYNKGLNNAGKWNRMMDACPRRLAVFQPLIHDTVSAPLPVEPLILGQWKDSKIGRSLSEDFTHSFSLSEEADSVIIEISMLPNHPLNNHSLRYSIEIEGVMKDTVSILTQGRSETWKKNVLTNRSTKSFSIKNSPKKPIVVKLKALDSGIFLREIAIKKAE